MKETLPQPEDQPALFEVRRFLGRTVFILGDLVQPDFNLESEE